MHSYYYLEIQFMFEFILVWNVRYKDINCCDKMRSHTLNGLETLTDMYQYLVQVQWNAQNDGRCGACGDHFDQSPKPHEDIGGKYLTCVITGVYEAGTVMETQVLLTACLKGWFELRCVSF